MGDLGHLHAVAARPLGFLEQLTEAGMDMRESIALFFSSRPMKATICWSSAADVARLLISTSMTNSVAAMPASESGEHVGDARLTKRSRVPAAAPSADAAAAWSSRSRAIRSAASRRKHASSANATIALRAQAEVMATHLSTGRRGPGWTRSFIMTITYD
ncbi:MAG: hypothetical protein H0W72_04800 [Planctomycetes bacterium]|nr:hypothetical protein [Planctomycetota bacterium]